MRLIIAALLMFAVSNASNALDCSADMYTSPPYSNADLSMVFELSINGGTWLQVGEIIPSALIVNSIPLPGTFAHGDSLKCRAMVVAAPYACAFSDPAECRSAWVESPEYIVKGKPQNPNGLRIRR